MTPRLCFKPRGFRRQGSSQLRQNKSIGRCDLHCVVCNRLNLNVRYNDHRTCDGRAKERGGLVPSSHRIREAGRVLRKTYKDTVSGDEILRWLINVKKVASSRVDALEICQSLLSQNFIRRVEDQAKKMKMKASVRSVNIVAEHFEAGKDCLYTYTSKTNSGKRRGRRRRGRVQRFSIMGAREALANDRKSIGLKQKRWAYSYWTLETLQSTRT